MRDLQSGLTGQDVLDAQVALTRAGCYSGDIDGSFGPMMQAAVIRFQNANNLQPSGVVHADTAAALKLIDQEDAACCIAGLSPDLVYPMFPGTPKQNIAANLSSIINALSDIGLGDRNMVAMALATLRAEAAVFLPVSEKSGSANTNGQPFDKYIGRLGNQNYADAVAYRGRGFIQLTGRSNYAAMSQTIFKDTRLVDDPLLAHDRTTAAKVLAAFLKQREPALRKAFANNDMAAARAAVNGGQNGAPVFITAFQECSGLGCLQQLTAEA